MIESYQEERQLDVIEPENQQFATIGTVYTNGVTLIFDGAGTQTQKRYKVNSAIVFKAGDRVKIMKYSGTYIVEYPVGNPKMT